jgi:hypothetical protein
MATFLGRPRVKNPVILPEQNCVTLFIVFRVICCATRAIARVFITREQSGRSIAIWWSMILISITQKNWSIDSHRSVNKQVIDWSSKSIKSIVWIFPLVFRNERMSQIHKVKRNFLNVNLNTRKKMKTNN